MPPFPIGVWGTVHPASRNPASISRVKIDAAGSSFLLITEEPNGTFDTWLETTGDVLAALSKLSIRWDT